MSKLKDSLDQERKRSVIQAIGGIALTLGGLFFSGIFLYVLLRIYTNLGPILNILFGWGNSGC